MIWFVGLIAVGLFSGLGLLSLGKESGRYIAVGSILVGMTGGVSLVT